MEATLKCLRVSKGARGIGYSWVSRRAVRRVLSGNEGQIAHHSSKTGTFNAAVLQDCVFIVLRAREQRERSCCGDLGGRSGQCSDVDRSSLLGVLLAYVA